MKVLIVGKTYMQQGRFCVGGLALDPAQSLRLLTEHGENQPHETALEVGQIWEVTFAPKHDTQPPHVEDVLVQSQAFLASEPGARELILRTITPWHGGISKIFDGLLQHSPNGSSFVSHAGGIPSCSTGFWSPDQPLCKVIRHINGRQRIYFRYGEETDYTTYILPYVGTLEMPNVVPTWSLVRVSLARWWSANETEKRCYLQLSGWFPA